MIGLSFFQIPFTRFGVLSSRIREKEWWAFHHPPAKIIFSFRIWTESIVYIIIAPWAIPVKRVFVPCFSPLWFPELVCTHQGFRSYTWSAQADSNWSSHIWQKILLTIVALLLCLLASFTICSFVLTKSNRIHSCNWLIGLSVNHFLSHICFKQVLFIIKEKKLHLDLLPNYSDTLPVHMF